MSPAPFPAGPFSCLFLVPFPLVRLNLSRTPASADKRCA